MCKAMSVDDSHSAIDITTAEENSVRNCAGFLEGAALKVPNCSCERHVPAPEFVKAPVTIVKKRDRRRLRRRYTQ